MSPTQKSSLDANRVFFFFPSKIKDMKFFFCYFVPFRMKKAGLVFFDLNLMTTDNSARGFRLCQFLSIFF